VAIKTANYANESVLNKRATLLLHDHLQTVYKRVDRAFAALLIFQWIAAMVIAYLISPSTWAGQFKQTHIHVWTAIFLGGVIIAWPVFLAYKKPGDRLTRHVIAVSQMLFSSLLVHLTGGRIETHFHIFGSLAFLATYCDWQVLVSASLVVAGNHLLGGIFWPQSVYGILTVEPWRWLEHSGWVVFEDIFLARSCCASVKDMHVVALRQAELEQTRESVEQVVQKRTEDLFASETRLSTQYAVTRALADAESFEQAAPDILREIGAGTFVGCGTVYGAIWQNDAASGKLRCIDWFVICKDGSDGLGGDVRTLSEMQALGGSELPVDVCESGQLTRILDLRNNQQPADLHFAGFASAFAFPVVAEGQIIAAMEFLTQKPFRLSTEQSQMIESLGAQIGQFTVRKRIELSNRHLADIVQCSADAIYGHTLDGVITSWNGGAEKLYGYAPEEIIGKSLINLVPPEKREESASLNEKNRQGQLTDSVETIRQRKNGTLVEVSSTRSPVFDQSGRVIAISSISRDITERKESEKQVSEFYSCVSHELRTPLTAIRGALGLIEGKVVQPDSEKANQLICMARNSADRLIRLINTILDLKKLESGNMDMKLEELDPESFIANTLHDLYALAQESDIELTQEMRAPGTLFADQDLLVQVLTNLVSNAIKFSPRKSQILVRFDQGKQGFGRISVIDKGIGIPADQIHKLFQKFQQVDSSDSRAQGGTGLGLAISRALVQQHGGEMGVISSFGQGSCFWFEIPFKTSNSRISASADDETAEHEARKQISQAIGSDLGSFEPPVSARQENS
jgi:two-component system, sensor histidine kinase and response regulator